jgi:hypothetical protein
MPPQRFTFSAHHQSWRVDSQIVPPAATTPALLGTTRLQRLARQRLDRLDQMPVWNLALIGKVRGPWNAEAVAGRLVARHRFAARPPSQAEWAAEVAER